MGEHRNHGAGDTAGSAGETNVAASSIARRRPPDSPEATAPDSLDLAATAVDRGARTRTSGLRTEAFGTAGTLSAALSSARGEGRAGSLVIGRLLLAIVLVAFAFAAGFGARLLLAVVAK